MNTAAKQMSNQNYSQFTRNNNYEFLFLYKKTTYLLEPQIFQHFLILRLGLSCVSATRSRAKAHQLLILGYCPSIPPFLLSMYFELVSFSNLYITEQHVFMFSDIFQEAKGVNKKGNALRCVSSSIRDISDTGHSASIDDFVLQIMLVMNLIRLFTRACSPLEIDPCLTSKFPRYPHACPAPIGFLFWYYLLFYFLVISLFRHFPPVFLLLSFHFHLKNLLYRVTI